MYVFYHGSVSPDLHVSLSWSEKGVWERDPPLGEEEGAGWGDREPSGADVAAGPNHLLHLVHLLGEEITTCEAQLRDELDQRKRYKVRNTRIHHCFSFHSICSFTS